MCCCLENFRTKLFLQNYKFNISFQIISTNFITTTMSVVSAVAKRIVPLFDRVLVQVNTFSAINFELLS